MLWIEALPTKGVCVKEVPNTSTDKMQRSDWILVGSPFLNGLSSDVVKLGNLWQC